MLLSVAWGKVIHEKNLKQKISWHCPFKRLKMEQWGGRGESVYQFEDSRHFDK